MTSRITVDTTGIIFDDQKRKPQFEKGLRAGLRDVAADITSDTQNKLQQGKRGFWRGQLRSSISFRQFSNLGFEIASGAALGQQELTYAKYVEYGRRAGKMPPRSAIEQWAFSHGFTSQTVFLLQRAIGRKGTKGVHMFRNTADEWNRKSSQIRKTLSKEIQRAMNK
jgi:hypothetical protein